MLRWQPNKTSRVISVIIPTFNEGEQLGKTIGCLRKHADAEHLTEIIVVDGGSTDNTLCQAARAGAKVVTSAIKGRAAQMNAGAELAVAPILYFLHADTVPPRGFTAAIVQAIQAGLGSGCFTLAFDYKHWFLRVNCWFTRFNINYFRFGDQSLFVSAAVFRRSGGFRPDYQVLEDQEIIARLKKLAPFRVIEQPVVTSARKYLHNGIYKTQGIFFLIYAMYSLGFCQPRLVATYKRLICQDKL
jgi:rSAM/selenodomain-associated transferase 2